MSKIEEALKKARALQEVEPRTLPDYPGPPAGRPNIADMREPRLRTPEELSALRVAHPRMRRKQVLHAFRNLRTTLIQASAGRNAVLVVTSTAPHGGTSFVSMNLAASIALDEGRTAVLMDCHLERPAFETLSVESDNDGLVDYLNGEGTAVERIIHATGVPRLRLLPSGNPAGEHREYFAMPRFQSLLKELKSRYADRFIIIDAPPLSQSADARVLATLADAVLLVVPYGRTTDAQIDEAAEQLGPDKLLGALINDEPSSALWQW